MKVAIMQPYIFPYIGYFQLINAVDKFIFYDDVNYIKRGWINRNQILVNNKSFLFSIPLQNASQNKLINEIQLAIDKKWLNRFYSTLESNYKKAPFFEETYQLIQSIFSSEHKYIADLSIDSVISISNHLEISTVFEKSSVTFFKSKGMEKANRLIEISKQCEADAYINPSGGKELYNKGYFNKKDVDLFFIENNISPYPQFKKDIVSGLSIIDVMMFNSKEEIKIMLNQYKLT